MFCLSLQPGHYSSLTAPNLQHTANQERNDQCGNQHYSRELVMMGIVMPETCWACKKYNNKWHLAGFFFILQLSQWCTVQQTSGAERFLEKLMVLAKEEYPVHIAFTYFESTLYIKYYLKNRRWNSISKGIVTKIANNRQNNLLKKIDLPKIFVFWTFLE